jgi:hypothetical protein
MTAILLTSHRTLNRASKVVPSIAHSSVLQDRGGGDAGHGENCDEALHVGGGIN